MKGGDDVSNDETYNPTDEQGLRSDRKRGRARNDAARLQRSEPLRDVSEREAAQEGRRQMSQGEWVRKEEETFKFHGDLEAQLKATFDKILEKAMKEMKAQADEGIGRPFRAWGVLRVENGQSIIVSIEGQPPTIPMVPSNN